MQVTATVLLKVSEDDLLHILENWVECCKNAWFVKDILKIAHYCIYLSIRRACFLLSV
jgi:hypothetical protein